MQAPRNLEWSQKSECLAESLNDLADLLEAKGEYTYDYVNEKHWVLGDGGRAGNCEECVEASDEEWVDDDYTYDMFDEDVDGPPGHPNCTCELEYRERRVRVYV